MNRIELALEMFKKGFNCSQAVLSAYHRDFNLDKEVCLKLASAFGGGIARQGEICGALTGAFMVLGLKNCEPGIEKPNNNTYRLTEQFIKEFKNTRGTIFCRELIHCNINTPEGHKRAMEENIFTKLCPGFIKTSIEILETLL